MRRMTLGMIVLAAFVGLTGCSASRNEHSFKSEPHLPTTLQLTDALSGNVIWAMNIPVGDRLTVDFDRPNDVEFIKNAHEPPSLMKWKLYHIATGWQSHPYKTGKVDLNSRVVMKVSYRPTPEYPPGYKVAGVPESEIASVTQDTTPPAKAEIPKHDTLNPNQQGENISPAVADVPTTAATGEAAPVAEPTDNAATPAAEKPTSATETTPGVIETTPSTTTPPPADTVAPAAPEPAQPAPPADPKLDL